MHLSDVAGWREVPRIPASWIIKLMEVRRHRMRRNLWPLVLLVILAAARPLAAAEATYVTHDQVDLTKLLAPPPTIVSEEQKRDLAELLAVQKSRTDVQTQRALADITAGTFGFADVLGPNFSAERLPKV